MKTKSGFVAVVGHPNAGKSTLINTLLKDQLLITSEKKQTTRRSLRCIVTGADYQMIFVDTPGTHVPRNKLGDFMAREIEKANQDSDVIMHVVDGTNPGDEFIGTSSRKPKVLVLNKADLLSEQEAYRLTEKYKESGDYDGVLAVSALTGANIDSLLTLIKALLPEGQFLYPEDQLVDCDLRFIAAEVIREQALLLLSDEIPHGVAVEINEFNETEADVTIAASVILEQESHKPIVIGKGGAMLGSIGRSARLKLQVMLDTVVHLRLWVKVRKNWRKDPTQLKWLGYK